MRGHPSFLSFDPAVGAFRSPLSPQLSLIVIEALNNLFVQAKELPLMLGLIVSDEEERSCRLSQIFIDEIFLFCRLIKEALFSFICIFLFFSSCLWVED